VRIATALCERGIANMSCSGSCSVDRLRVQTGGNERHVLEEQRERVRSRSLRTLLGASVKYVKGRIRWRGGRASFRRHLGRRKETSMT
jgi:hypothetical protein